MFGYKVLLEKIGNFVIRETGFHFRYFLTCLVANSTERTIMCDQSGSISDLSARDDYRLVLKIMQTVDRHNRDEQIDPDPLSLRDTMLTMAALLHLEAIKMDGGNQLAAAGDGEQLRETFASAACRQLDAVAEASATIHRDHTGEYQ
jgi:hypothetical protein